jgi:cobalt-zinc-cadmium efflux system outer membrane protein
VAKRMNLMKWCRALSVALCAVCMPMMATQWNEAGVSEPRPRGGTNVLALSEAIRIALESSPELQASWARVEVAAGRAYQASKWTNPQLQINADEWPVTGGGRGFPDSIQTIGIAQTLPYPGKKSLDKRIGGAGVRVSEAELALRRTEVVRDVKAGFYQVLASERVVEVSSQLVVVAQSSAVAARKRVEAGASPYQEQLRAEVQLVQAQADLREFQRELAKARQAFFTVLGRQDLSGAALSGALSEVSRSALMAEKAEEFLPDHPSMRAARANVDRAELEYRRARLEPYPDVTASFSGGKLGETDQGIIQLGFSFPLPILDRSKGKKDEARANVRVAEAELRVVQQQLLREWANAQKRYRTAAEQVASYRQEALPKADEALRLVRTGFEEGKFTFIDLADTQRTAAEVRLAYQHRLLELNIAEAEVEALMRPEMSELPKAKSAQTKP